MAQIAMPRARQWVRHVVVLMLENRSFDSLLGTLYPSAAYFEGLTGAESNPWRGHRPVRVWNRWPYRARAPETGTIPDPDPGEQFSDIDEQLFDGRHARASMKGFVNNYARHCGAADPRAIMHYYRRDELPVLSTLAEHYAVCDQWFASAPCQTWPNRFFAHAATAGGWVNNSPVHLPDFPTIFGRFAKAPGAPAWRVYFHDIAQSLTLRSLWQERQNFVAFEEHFSNDAARGRLPAYSFIEPRYFAEALLPNDQHPPHHVALGETLIATVYNALRTSPCWGETLLVVTYDEHGGSYDHVAPPAATPPTPATQRADPAAFAFDRLGVRVPAVLVSPHIRRGTRLRAAPDVRDLSARRPAFDHCSIIATLRGLFELGEPLTARDAHAPTLESVLDASGAINDGLPVLALPDYLARQDELDAALDAPLTDMQKGLSHLAELLEDGNLVQHWLARLDEGMHRVEEALPFTQHARVRDAVPQVRARTRRFLGG